MTTKFDYLLILIESLIFPYAHAMSVGVGHIIPLCVDILCHKKQVIWMYLIFLYSCYVFLNSMIVLPPLLTIYENDPMLMSFLTPYILNTLLNLRLKLIEMTN